MTPVSRLTCASERSRWKGVGSTLVDRQGGQDLPVAAERVAVGAERRAAVLLDLPPRAPLRRARLARRDLGGGEAARRGSAFFFRLGGIARADIFTDHGSRRGAGGVVADLVRGRARGRASGSVRASRRRRCAATRRSMPRSAAASRSGSSTRTRRRRTRSRSATRSPSMTAPDGGGAPARRGDADARQSRPRRGVRGGRPRRRAPPCACRSATIRKRTRGSAVIGAELVEEGRDYDEAVLVAERLVRERGLTPHPLDERRARHRRRGDADARDPARRAGPRCPRRSRGRRIAGGRRDDGRADAPAGSARSTASRPRARARRTTPGTRGGRCRGTPAATPSRTASRRASSYAMNVRGAPRRASPGS